MRQRGKHEKLSVRKRRSDRGGVASREKNRTRESLERERGNRDVARSYGGPSMIGRGDE